MPEVRDRTRRPRSTRRPIPRRESRLTVRAAGLLAAIAIATGAIAAPPAAAQGARYLGSVASEQAQNPIVAIAATPTGNGYWLTASDGGIFAFGDASFHGSAAGQPTIGAIASMAASPHDGYWMVTADGAVLTATPSSGLIPDPNLLTRTPEAAIAQDLFHRINDERAARGLRARVGSRAHRSRDQLGPADGHRRTHAPSGPSRPLRHSIRR